MYFEVLLLLISKCFSLIKLNFLFELIFKLFKILLISNEKSSIILELRLNRKKNHKIA